MPVDYFTVPVTVLDFWLQSMHARKVTSLISSAVLKQFYFLCVCGLGMRAMAKAEVMMRVIIVCLDENCYVFVCMASNDSPVIQALLPGNCICRYAI